MRSMSVSQQPQNHIRDEFDLLALWTQVSPAVGLDQRTLCLVFLDEDERVLPTLVPMDDLPAWPDDELVSGLRHIVRESTFGGPAASVVMLLSRPGGDAITAQDRNWSTELGSFSDWPLCLATHGGIQLLESDDLEETG
jgi:hypothetical protein